MPVIDMVAKIPASYYIAVKWQKRFNDKIKYVFTLIDYNPPTRTSPELLILGNDTLIYTSGHL